MIQKLKILHLLSSLKKKEFFYSFKKQEFWIRVVTAILVLYVVANSISTSSFLINFIKSNFNSSSKNFKPIFNIILFALFLSNIIAIIFLGTANYNQSFIKTLFRYPITLKQIIFFRTVSVSSELLNIIFLPLYVSAYFIAGNSFNLTGIIVFLFILFLFLFCINSFIEFLRNSTAAIISLKKFKLLFWALTFVFLISILLLIPRIPFYFSNEQSVKKVSDILFYSPTGVFTKSIFALTGNISTSQILIYGFYFLFIAAALFSVNLFLVIFYKNRDFGKVLKKQKLRKPVITSLFNKISLGPFEKKNFVYLVRSPRALLNVLVFIIYEIILVYFVTVHLYDGSAPNIYVTISFTILFQSLIILSYTGNFFAFDYSGIINYFFRPLKTKSLIKSKILIVNILVIFNMLVFIYFALLFKVNKYDLLLQADFLIFAYFISLFVAVLLSLFFPKGVGFYAIMGTNAPFLAVVISAIISMGFWGLDYLLLAKIKFISTKLAIIFLVTLINFGIIYFKKNSFALFNKILIKQKEKIIEKLI